MCSELRHTPESSVDQPAQFRDIVVIQFFHPLILWFLGMPFVYIGIIAPWFRFVNT
jgi:hypothetical protein